MVQKRPVDVPVANCLVIHTRRAHKCGKLDGISFGPTTIDYETKVFPTPEECLHMVKYELNTGTDRSQTHIIKLNPSGTTTTSAVTEGKVDSMGYCERAYFWRNGQQYYGSVETTEVSICFRHKMSSMLLPTGQK